MVFVGGLELKFLLECFDGRWVLKLGLMLGWIGLVGYWVLALFDRKKKVY